MSYVYIAMRHYKKNLKNIKSIKNMAPNVTDMIISSLDEIKNQQKDIFKRLNGLEISVAQIKVKMLFYASLVGAVTSAIFTQAFKIIIK